VMEKRKPPIKIVIPGKVFRKETPDPTHLPMFYQLEGLQDVEVQKVDTPFGTVEVKKGVLVGDKVIAFMPRHGEKHQFLPNMINHKANLHALKKIGAKAIIGTTVCGVLKPELNLARPVIFNDVFFPSNAMPGGEYCSAFTTESPDKGHWIFGSPFNQKLREQLKQVCPEHVKGIYCHATGPRFNSKPEIKFFAQFADYVSQTAGPEIVLAGELEMPYALLGFSVDYANGVKEVPTPAEELGKNIEKAKETFHQVLRKLVAQLEPVDFDGFVYRFK